MKTKIKKEMVPTYLGSGAGFLAFLGLGAVPGLLYGGYMGLAIAAVLFGTPVQTTGFAGVIIWGGMLLGLLAALFFFLVFGALFGTLAGAVIKGVSRIFVHKPEEIEAKAKVE